MENNIFRKKSIERINSPEQLNDYIKVVKPSIWMLMGAIIIFLIGVCVWGIFGQLDTKVESIAVVKNHSVSFYVAEDDFKKIDCSHTIVIEGKEYAITEIVSEPINVGRQLDEYTKHRSTFQDKDWVYVIRAKADIQDGTYAATITVDSMKPMNFILN